MKILLVPIVSGEKETNVAKSSETEMVFLQFAKILSILEVSSATPPSKDLFDETWSRFLTLTKSIDPCAGLFNFIYTISSVNLIDQSSAPSTVKTVSFTQGMMITSVVQFQT